jgi:hypothetical protein
MGDENVEMMLLPIFFFVVLSRKVWESSTGTKRKKTKVRNVEGKEQRRSRIKFRKK